ncbi:unnamed protein product, partial [marine sediment metagenome]
LAQARFTTPEKKYPYKVKQHEGEGDRHPRQ